MRALSYRWPRLVVGAYRFNPPGLATLAVLILLPVFISLGFWQWHRAQANLAILQAFAAGTQSKFIQLPDKPESLTLVSRFQHVEVSGTYDPDSTLVLDNVIQDHRAGYRILGVFQPSNSQAKLLVDRGFIAKGVRSQQDLLHLTIPIGHLQLKGILDRPYVPVVRFRDPRNPSNLLDGEDLAKLQKQVARPFYPLVLVQMSSDPAGFVQSEPSPPDKVLMHQGYALQWWAFALTLVATYFFVNIKKRHK